VAKRSLVRCLLTQAPLVGFGGGGGRVRARFLLLVLPRRLPSDFKMQTVLSPQASEAVEGGKATLATTKKPLQPGLRSLPAEKGAVAGAGERPRRWVSRERIRYAALGRCPSPNYTVPGAAFL